MTEADEAMTRYLLGELSDAERSQMEARYFTDKETFDQLVQRETALVDDYARDRLSPQMRARFERAYLSNPNGRALLRFGEAMTSRFDEIASLARVTEQTSTRRLSWWQRFTTSLTSGRRALAFSMALAILLLASVSIWSFIESSRLRQDLAKAREAQTAQAERERETQQQLAAEQKRAQELSAELDQRANNVTSQTQPQPEPTPTPLERPAPVVASLILTANSIRGVDLGAASRLIIPHGAQQVRLQLNSQGNGYRNYQLVLQAIGGREIFNQRVKPTLTKSGVSFVITLPASKLNVGDYMLTLKGLTMSGESEDISQSLFRVENK